MDEEEFIRQLVRRGRSPETVQSIVSVISGVPIQQNAKEKYGRELSLEEAEAIARVWRIRLLADVSLVETGIGTIEDLLSE